MLFFLCWWIGAVKYNRTCSRDARICHERLTWGGALVRFKKILADHQQSRDLLARHFMQASDEICRFQEIKPASFPIYVSFVQSGRNCSSKLLKLWSVIEME